MLPHNESSTEGTVFGGIDWGGLLHKLCLIDAAGNVLLQRRITHDVVGLAELDRILGQHTSGLTLAIERAEGLLVEHLHTPDVPVYCVSPKIAARARERYRTSAAKSDALDAFVLADTLRRAPALALPIAAVTSVGSAARSDPGSAACPLRTAGVPVAAAGHFRRATSAVMV